MKIKEYECAEDIVNMVIDRIAPACVLISRGGLGKSYLVKTLCEEKCPDDYKYFSGHITPKQLYIYLYQHKDKIVVFDDIGDLLESDKAVSILNSALWPVKGKRTVKYATTNKDGSTEFMEFDFTGGVILLLNKIPREKQLNVQALKSRELVIKLELTYKQIMRISEEILQHDSFYHLIGQELDKKEREQLIIDFRKSTPPAIEHLNFRTMEKFVMFFKYCKKAHPDNPNRHIELHRITNTIDEEKELVYHLLDTKLPVGSQITKFVEVTGKSRATFYRIKKAIEKEEKIDRKNREITKNMAPTQKQKSSKLQEQMNGHRKKEKKLDEVSKYHKKDRSEPANDSDRITIDHLLNEIHQLDLDIKKIGNGYISIKHNGRTLCYVRDTEYGIAWEHHTIEGWENEKIRTKNQFDMAIDRLRNLISKPNQERISLEIGDELLYDFLDAVKQMEPSIVIDKGDGKYQYNLLIETAVIAKVMRRKDGKLKFNWVEKNKMRGMILNGRDDYSKALYKIKELTDIHTKRSDINKWL